MIRFAWALLPAVHSATEPRVDFALALYTAVDPFGHLRDEQGVLIRSLSDECHRLCEKFSATSQGNGFDLCENGSSECILGSCSNIYWSMGEDGGMGLLYEPEVLSSDLCTPVSCQDAIGLVYRHEQPESVIAIRCHSEPNTAFDLEDVFDIAFAGSQEVNRGYSCYSGEIQYNGNVGSTFNDTEVLVLDIHLSHGNISIPTLLNLSVAVYRLYAFMSGNSTTIRINDSWINRVNDGNFTPIAPIYHSVVLESPTFVYYQPIPN